MQQLVDRLRRGRRSRGEGERGQSLILIVVAFVGILGFVGLAIDIAWAFVELVRLSQAVDSAVLAAAGELPLESAARERALVYLQGNGYDFVDADTVVVTDSYTNGQYTSDPDAVTTIWIDTAYSRQEGLADSVLIRVRRRVYMVFGQFIGIKYFPVEDTAEAENITNIDTVIVYDRSGSMEFYTLCYGCWEAAAGLTYPLGTIWPFHWSDTTVDSADHCAGWTAGGGYECGSYGSSAHSGYDVNDCSYRAGSAGSYDYYFVIEAEEYSYANSDWAREFYVPYKTYWVPQHNGRSSYGRPDPRGYGGYISHHPYRTSEDSMAMGLNCQLAAVQAGYCQMGKSAAPVVEYDFYVPEAGSYHVWLRGQGGNSVNGDDGLRRHIFWALDAGNSAAVIEDGFTVGATYDGAASGSWEWQELTSSALNLAQGEHVLRLWAGGAGFDVDRMVITTDSDGPEDYGNDWETFEANNGRTRYACSDCDARFAGRPGGQSSPFRPDCPGYDMRLNDIYDDEQPIREALEAAKYFVTQLDPQFDQVGYVRFDTSSSIASQLQCLRSEGLDDCTPQVITDTVLAQLDSTSPTGSTDIADGMKDGIEVLRTGACSESDPTRCGRPGAAHIMILMTDGQPTTNPGEGCAGDPDRQWKEDDDNKDCVVYYAHEALDNRIIVYTISLGPGADQELMQYVADVTFGVHKPVDRPEDLYNVFQELYERIFLRLVR